MIEFADCASLFQHLRQPHIIDYKRYGHLTDNLHEAESDEEEEVSPAVQSLEQSAEESKSECGICNFSMGSARSTKSRHYETWHRGGQIQCSHCSTAYFRTKWQFAIHLANQHQIKIQQDCFKCKQVHCYYRKDGNGRYSAYHHNSRIKLFS